MTTHTSLSQSFILRLRSSLLCSQMMLGRLSLVMASVVAVGVGAVAQAAPHQTQAPVALAPISIAQQQPNFPAPGRYLFGQAPEAEQLGHGYMVLDTTGEQPYGVLYFPGSSFDCFYGQVQGGELAMTIISAYSQETYPYSIALATNTTVAAGSVSSGLEPLRLEGFYSLDGPSENDLRMLGMCEQVVSDEL